MWEKVYSYEMVKSHKAGCICVVLSETLVC